MTISCKQAQELASIIDRTAQIEDLLATEGMEEELKGMDLLAIPTQIPTLAETIDAFNTSIKSLPSKPSNQEVANLIETSQSIRKETTPFLIAAFTNCVTFKERR